MKEKKKTKTSKAYIVQQPKAPGRTNSKRGILQEGGNLHHKPLRTKSKTPQGHRIN